MQWWAPNADNPQILKSNYDGCRGGSSAFVNRADPSKPCRLVTPLQGLRARLPSRVNVSFHPGSTPESANESVAAAAAADVAILVVGLLPWDDDAGGHAESGVAEGEAHDRVHIGLPDEQRALVRAVLAAQARSPPSAIQKGTRVLISLWDTLMFGRVPGSTRPNISESHSEISTRVPFCIVAGRRALAGTWTARFGVAAPGMGYAEHPVDAV